ncbi:MAG: ribonuclease D [Rickettsiales bacterium]|nr:ribonuclease D [Rickettsiales bacterium]
MTIYIHQNDIPDDLVFSGKEIAIDTETMGLNIKRDNLCLVQISEGDGNAHLVKFDINKGYDAPNLKKLLSNDKILKIFHFARFDVAVIRYYLNVYMNNIFCTKIASRLSRTYTDFHGLKDLCSELLGVSISKAQQSSNWGAQELSNAQKKYAAQDVLYLHELKDKLTEMLKNNDRLTLANECFNFMNIRVDLDLNGWSSLDIFKH